MQNAYIEYFNSAEKTFFSLVQRVNDISSQTLQKLADLQLNFASIQIENTLEHLKLFTTTTRHNQLLSGVSSLADQYSTQTIGLTHKAASILASTSEEVLALMNTGLKTTAVLEKTPVKRAVKKSVKG